MSPWRRPALLILVPLFAAAAGGCHVGYNSMLFVTKSNVGLDVDSAPPTAQIAIGRVEAVFAPSFEGGQNLPVEASFLFESGNIFSPSLGSTFAVGDAALVLARLYDTSAAAPQDWEQFEKEHDSALRLTRRPEPPGSPLPGPGQVRPMVFGTDTSLGLKVAWSGLTAGLPDTLRFGYHRKELAIVPVTYQADPAGGDRPHLVKTPSLIGTIDAATEVKDRGGTTFVYHQYFATGRAATALAAHDEIRGALREKLGPAAVAVAAQPMGDEAARIDRWLGADPANQAKLGQWMRQQQIGGFPAIWLRAGKVDEYRRAITELQIP